MGQNELLSFCNLGPGMGAVSSKSNVNSRTDCPIGLKFKLWAFENRRTNIRWVRNFSGPCSWPKGHKLKGKNIF